MSADNYLYVWPLPDGRWAVTMEFASVDPECDLDRARIYTSKEEAIEGASEWYQQESFVEYGIHVAGGVR